MSNQRYTPEFKEEAVRQVLEKGHTVPAVAERLGVSAHSLYKWVNAVNPSDHESQANELIEAKSEVLRLRVGLARWAFVVGWKLKRIHCFDHPDNRWCNVSSVNLLAR